MKDVYVILAFAAFIAFALFALRFTRKNRNTDNNIIVITNPPYEEPDEPKEDTPSVSP